MITLRDVHKSFHQQELFDGASLQINAGDRYALVGPNGAGKSTLFKMILGEVEPDGGELALKRGVTLGYLPQENAPLGRASVLQEALAGVADPDGRTAAEAKKILMGLGFTEAGFSRPVGELSGGWAMRVAMARLLLAEPDLLMMDEPTNHLDLYSLRWFEERLKGYRGAIFLISHDRDFINQICDAVVSVQDKTLKIYRGTFEDYVAERAAERERLLKAYEQQRAEIAEMEEFVRRNRARASTAARAQSVIKKLDKIERIVPPAEAKTVRIRFPQPERTGVRSLQLKGAHKSYGDLKVYEGLDFEMERGWRMALVGRNGAGKSTLLKMLAGVLPFEKGERVLGLGVKTGYFSQHRVQDFEGGRTVLQEALDTPRIPPELLVRSVLGAFLFPGDSVHKSVRVLSGGEKSRLALARLLLDPPNVLLLDEPTTHLDMDSVEALINALREFEGTVCFISHDVHFINAVATHVAHVEDGKVTLYPGNYEYFQHRTAGMGPAGAAAQDGAAPPPGGGKEYRQARAQDRERVRAIARLERSLAEGHARLETLAERLGDPELYKDYAQAEAVGEEIQVLQDRLQAEESELGRLKRDG